MTTALLVGFLVWMVGVEWRLWVNIHRLNEHLEELHQDMNFLTTSAATTPQSRPREAPEIWRGSGPRSRPPLIKPKE
jgi:hypothetical protein